MLHNLKNNLIRYHIVLLAALWLLMQVVLYQYYGIKIMFDSRRYLYITDLVLAGTYQPEGNISYFSYILFIAAFLKTGLSLKAVILAQVLLSGLAAVCLYKITNKLAFSRTAAVCATLLYIGWPDLQSWNFYIHTESVFVSLSIIMLYLLLKPFRLYRLWYFIPLWVVVLFIRPNGFLIFVASMAFLLTRLKLQNPEQGRKIWRLSLVAGLPLFALMANTILYNIRNIFSFTRHFENGEIIQGYTGWIMQPETPFNAPEAGQPVFMLFDLFRENGAYVLKLMALRLLIYFAQIRPYYTLLHNLVIIVFMFPVYGLALYSLRYHRIHSPAKAFVLTLILGQIGITLLSAVDWDNRFILPLLPFIFIYAGITAGKIVQKKVLVEPELHL